MILPTSLALDTTKNRRTVDNAFSLQVMQMILDPDRHRPYRCVAGMAAWFGDDQAAVKVNLELLFLLRLHASV
ncbi:hypothetical protein VDF14_17730 [Xanthomonas campestris pv. raphani]|nr:hypothetical protein [Xanthomonas campestris pv. raphani]